MLALTALAACHDNRAGADSRICTPFPATAGAAADLGAVVDDCLHRWGYALAAGRDAAEPVAQATVAACAPALARWNEQALPGATAAPTASSRGAPAPPSAGPGSPLAEHYAYAQGRALFYVAQARAGNCAPPRETAPSQASR